MPIFKSQAIYGFSGDSKPILIGEGDDKNKLVSYDDHITAMGNAEDAVGQIIVQDNAESTRLNGMITSLSPSQLGGTATLSDVIEQINIINTILTNLVVNGK